MVYGMVCFEQRMCLLRIELSRALLNVDKYADHKFAHQNF